MSSEPIYVTKPSLPPLSEFLPYLEQVWENRILTNNGPFHQSLENELAKFLGVKEVSLFNNGMSALVTAIHSLNLTGEVITTPFSFVATTHALALNNLKPVFVDIDPHTLNIDPLKIEAAITSKTSAILAVHCYGNPCDVEKIETIAKKHKLKVIYDAAHAFAVNLNGKSILNYGDLSILSFHATKVFNTFEGGATISHDSNTKKKIDLLKNFGIENETTVSLIGSNGKISEVNCCMGLLQLKYIEQYINSRKETDEAYRDGLKSVRGIRCLSTPAATKPNFAYFPILVSNDYPLSRDLLNEKLKEHNIYSRRYFYPLISNFPTYNDLPSSKPSNLIEANKAADQILCLPIYPGLSFEDQHRIISIIQEYAQ